MAARVAEPVAIVEPKASWPAAEAYARPKRALAALGIDRDTYADAKDPACDLILIAAEDWAARTGWQPR